MRPVRLLRPAALGVALAVIVSVLCWLGIVLTQHQPATQTDAAGTIAVSPAFAHYYQHHVGIADACKNPLSRATFLHGVADQHFEHCALIAIYSVAPFPIPTTPPLPSPVPTARPAPTATSAPAPTAIPSDDPVLYLLGLINGERGSHGYAPLTLNVKQSTQAQLHSFDMASTGSIWHVNSNFPFESWPAEIVMPYHAAGENVGEAGGPEKSAILYDFNQMLTGPGEAWTPGCVGSHHCSIDYPAFSSVGIGLAEADGLTYVTEDFIG